MITKSPLNKKNNNINSQLINATTKNSNNNNKETKLEKKIVNVTNNQQKTNLKNNNSNSNLSHNLEMNCLQNSSLWNLKITFYPSDENISNDIKNENFKDANNSSSFPSKNHNLNNNNSNTISSHFNGKNYFLNKLMLNYSNLLSNFNYFKLSGSFLDIFFVKSMQQNKDKIEFIKIKPCFPLNFSILSTFDKSKLNEKKDFFKFFVDFDLTKNEIFKNNHLLINKSKLEINLESKIHNISMFKYDNKIILDGKILIDMVRNRVLNVNRMEDLKNQEKKDKIEQNNNSNNKQKSELKEIYCSILGNSNFNMGFILRINDKLK